MVKISSDYCITNNIYFIEIGPLHYCSPIFVCTSICYPIQNIIYPKSYMAIWYWMKCIFNDIRVDLICIALVREIKELISGMVRIARGQKQCSKPIEI